MNFFTKIYVLACYAGTIVVTANNEPQARLFAEKHDPATPAKDWIVLKSIEHISTKFSVTSMLD